MKQYEQHNGRWVQKTAAKMGTFTPDLLTGSQYSTQHSTRVLRAYVRCKRLINTLLRYIIQQKSTQFVNETLDMKDKTTTSTSLVFKTRTRLDTVHSSGAVWESRWTPWAVRPNEPSGFRGRKDLLNRASALVTTCP